MLFLHHVSSELMSKWQPILVRCQIESGGLIIGRTYFGVTGHTFTQERGCIFTSCVSTSM